LEVVLRSDGRFLLDRSIEAEGLLDKSAGRMPELVEAFAVGLEVDITEETVAEDDVETGLMVVVLVEELLDPTLVGNGLAEDEEEEDFLIPRLILPRPLLVD